MRLSFSLLAFLAGCTLDVPREVWEPEIVQTTIEYREMPLPYIRPLDVLFVVDSAPSMEGERAALAANARTFAQALDYAVGLPDVHVAIVDSDLGTLGVDVGDPRCAGSGTAGRASTYACGIAGDFISQERDEWGEIRTNFDGTLDDALACVMTSIEPDGCPWRQPLEAMRRALAPGANPGFLRERANLLVVFVGDADDCSAADPALYAPDTSRVAPDPFRCFAAGVVCEGTDDPAAPGPRTGCRPREPSLLRSIDAYRDELLAVEPSPRDVAVAAITPAGEIVVEPGPALAEGCRSGSQAGTPAIRMRAFVEGFVDRHSVTSTCNADWSGVLAGLTPYLRLGRVATVAEDAARLRRHFARVETDLRATDVLRLNRDQREARAHHLDELGRYRDAGVFPHNHDEPDHAPPIFIDRHGTRCAMAHLIEQAGGAELVAEVAATRNGAYIPELADDPRLRHWLDRNGLTVEEAARIQPQYFPSGHTCIQGTPVDGDAAVDGIQPITAGSIVKWSEDALVEYAIPRCQDLPSYPCYRLEPADLCHSTPSRLAFTVEPPFLGFPGYFTAQIVVETRVPSPP